MKIKYSAIIGNEAAMKAVENNGYALQYVLDFDLFKKIASEFGIEVIDRLTRS